jgi:hypothetical protein
MATICYAWDNAPFKWLETPFTWAEGCIIEKIIVGGAGGMQSLKRVRERLKTLTQDEKITLIGLFVRLEVDEIIFEQRMNKQKNKKVKVKLKDVEVLMKEQKIIKVNVNLKDKDIY